MTVATQSSVEERHSRPAANEHAPYYSRYIDRVPAGDIVEILRNQIVETSKFLRDIPSDRTTSGYAPGKWTIRDIVGHLADTERIMSYRALRFARGDRTPVPGFEESDYAPFAHASEREMADLVSELQLVRAATVALFAGLPADAWRRAGSASGNEITVRALAAVIAGHERHHLAVIRERYLSGR
jgi:DinB family protein